MKRFLGLALVLGLLLGISTSTEPAVAQGKTMLLKGDDKGGQSDQADKPKYGSGSKPAPTTTPKPPPTKSYGSGDKPKPPTPPTGSTPAPAPPTKTYGSGDTPKPPDNKAPPKYGSGTTPPKYGSGSTVTPSPTQGVKPGTPQFDQKAAQAQKKAESKQAFLKGKEPATSYVTPQGKTVHIDPKDQRIADLRQQLSEEKWRTREVRTHNFYHVYYGRPVVVYHDPYSSFFWYWLLDRSIEQQALWAYHHRASMDAARYNDLMAKNADLAARVRALEQQGVQRNPTYQPTGMTDTDLMYNDGYVNAAFNAAPKPVQHQPVDGGAVLKVMLYIFLGLAIVALIVWLLFVKKW